MISVSLEITGSRHHCVLSLHALPPNVTRLSVKADFEKLAQGGRLPSVNAEEASEIYRSLFRKVTEAVASPSET